jgi:hypothetical protein
VGGSFQIDSITIAWKRWLEHGYEWLNGGYWWLIGGYELVIFGVILFVFIELPGEWGGFFVFGIFGASQWAVSVWRAAAKRAIREESA